MDPSVTHEQIAKFKKYLQGILDMKGMEIDDDLNSNLNLVITLKKIESRLNYLAEARNHLYDKDKRLSVHQRVHEDSIE